MTELLDLLARRVYAMAQVDHLLALPNGTARRWIDGYARAGRTYPPVVRLEPTGDDVVTWGEFAETRLLAEFRGAGVPLHRMRPAVERLREQFDRLYPLATALPWLDHAGRELVLRVQDEVDLEGRLRLVVVRNDQLILTAPADQFVRSADFADGIVYRLRPQPELRAVTIDPLRQFGEPAVRSVPTAVIAEQFRAGDKIATIADLYDLDESEVEQAIRFELIRGTGASQAA